MATDSGRFLKDNAFLVAAVALPLVVIGFFLLATAVPRTRVPPPAFDLVLQANRPYTHPRSPILVDYQVREGRVVANVRAAPEHTYPALPGLLLFDHRSMEVREIPVELPQELPVGESLVTVPVEALAGRRVTAESRGPDGYELSTRNHRGPGIIGDLFGMRRYDRATALVRDGRVVRLKLPSAYEPAYGIDAVGWIVD